VRTVHRLAATITLEVTHWAAGIRNQLIRYSGEPPYGAELRIKASHTTSEPTTKLSAISMTSEPESMEYAFRVENHAPEKLGHRSVVGNSGGLAATESAESGSNNRQKSSMTKGDAYVLSEIPMDREPISEKIWLPFIVWNSRQENDNRTCIRGGIPIPFNNSQNSLSTNCLKIRRIQNDNLWRVWKPLSLKEPDYWANEPLKQHPIKDRRTKMRLFTKNRKEAAGAVSIRQWPW